MTGPMLHLAVALDGYGWHPQAWRSTLAGVSGDPGSSSVLGGRYWADLATTAERGLLDFLTIDDTLMPQPGRRERIDPRRLAGRGDAVLVGQAGQRRSPAGFGSGRPQSVPLRVAS